MADGDESHPYKPWPVAVWWVIGVAVTGALAVFVGVPLLYARGHGWAPKVGQTSCVAAGSGQICAHRELQHFGDGGIVFVEVTVIGLAADRVVSVPGFTPMGTGAADETQFRTDATGGARYRDSNQSITTLTFTGNDANGGAFSVTLTAPPLPR